MRWDMFEVIIERPRYGSHGFSRKGRLRERTERAFDRAPGKLGMKRPGRTRYPNENLAPLRRFLRSRVGKPWAKVRSEISAVLSVSSTVQKHVMDHARQFVEENPIFIDGRPHHPAASGGKYRPLWGHPHWSDFYVCPKTGTLRETRWEKGKGRF